MRDAVNNNQTIVHRPERAWSPNGFGALPPYELAAVANLSPGSRPIISRKGQHVSHPFRQREAGKNLLYLSTAVGEQRPSGATNTCIWRAPQRSFIPSRSPRTNIGKT